MQLRKLVNKDVCDILDWMKDPQVNCYFRFNPDNITKESIEEFVEKSNNDSQNIHLAIVDEKDSYLGTISLKNIDYSNSNAEYAIVVKKEASGLGVGEWATKAILNIAFIEMKLNKVYLNVLADNIRAQRLYEKVGFAYEGELKEHVIINGQKKDLKLYGILGGNWDGN